jgi:hypothetical protein
MPLDSLMLSIACGVWIAWWLAYLLTLYRSNSTSPSSKLFTDLWFGHPLAFVFLLPPAG